MDTKILLAFIPFVFWALGDFFIQKTTRKIGVIRSLFYIGITSSIFALPFVYKELLSITISDFGILTMLGMVTFIYAIFLFRAFKVGKLSVVESIVALELPLTVGFSAALLGEKLNPTEILLFFVICFGIFLATFKVRIHKKLFLEKGFLLALGSSALSAFVNFYTGYTAQTISPLLSIYITHLTLTIICFAIIIFSRELKEIIHDLKTHPYLILLESLCDNIAWFGYAYAVLYTSIAITITISESYIILAALLGYFVNKEKLTTNQKIGAVITLTAVVLLTYVTQKT
jgi:drug/metabolite transporter (DMT)-like permease